MLQIITGKFYGNNEKYNNEKNIDMFSNARFEKEVHICHFTLEPKEDLANGLYKFNVRYNNQIEKQSGNFSLIDVGSDTVVYQLKNILTFCIGSYFDSDSNIVEKICQEKKAHSRHNSVPANYLRNTLDVGKIVQNDEIEKADLFIKNLVGLKREDFDNVMSCIRSYCASIRLLGEDPNLAYCVLIFALESLSQNYDKYEPVWGDYNDQIRSKLEKIFCEIDDENAEEIRNILSCESHLKLMQRFLHFIKEHINDEFFFDNEVKGKIPFDDVEPALKNAYNIRSKYAHQLKIIIDQSTTDDSSKVSDFYRHLHEPFFTYSGLLRLSRHVIFNLVHMLEKVEAEKIDWIDFLPGVIKVPLGPEFWMSKLESLKCLSAKDRLEGFIEGLSKSVVYDIKDVMDMYINQFHNVKEDLRKPIFALCVLWTNVIGHDDDCMEKYEKFIEENKERFNDCCIENMFMLTIPLKKSYSFMWDTDLVDKNLQAYISKKHKQNSYLFPAVNETLMYIIAEEFLEGDKERALFWKRKAIYNSINDSMVNEIVCSDKTAKKKIDDILSIKNKKAEDKLLEKSRK